MVVRSILNLLSERVSSALQAMGATGDPLVRPAQDEQFGHYQANCAMPLAKQLKAKPRDVAQQIVDHLDVADLCDPPELAGPGFINFRIRPDFLAAELSGIAPADTADADRLGLAPTGEPRTVVVDLSSPNLAKEMHVGHLRSTVIGDCVCRLLEFAGHDVHRENHVGDWGTQFGMLVAHLRHVRPDVMEHPEQLVISDLESFYVEAKTHFDADETFAEEARQTVVDLQQGDPATRRIWEAFCTESLRHCHAIYARLDVRLTDRGESFYAPDMEDVVRRLEERRQAEPTGMVRDSEGALCVFVEGFRTREGDALPLIVRKRDGGHNYATSDLATLLHRVEALRANRIIYVVGIAQKQHFDMVFAAARALGWVREDVELIHLGFGNMLAASGKPFKTREGGTVKLKDLLDEAVERARAVIDTAEPDARPGEALADDQRAHIAETIGLAAVKYFDLSHALVSDYKFDLDTMLSLEGNTAPYMLYAYARIRAIGRKGGVDFDTLPADAPLVLEHPAEVKLALTLARFADTLDAATRDLSPIVLTDYLQALAKAFSRFYDKKQGVRVLDASPDEVRLSRLRLCDLTARTLRLGLRLLGIDTLEYM